MVQDSRIGTDFINSMEKAFNQYYVVPLPGLTPQNGNIVLTKDRCAELQGMRQRNRQGKIVYQFIKGGFKS
jgi:hypothetical protein